MYIQFEIFKKYRQISCHFSNRKNGFSKDVYSELNLGMNTGDIPQTVTKNREYFYNALNIKSAKIAYPDQVHSASVQTATGPGIYSRTDALVSNQTGLFLAVQTADCTPLFLFDPRNNVIGVIHAGWRGCVSGIIENTFKKMETEFGSDPKNIVAAAGPCLQPCCFEVREDVFSLFDEKFLKPHARKEKKILDIPEFINSELSRLGVLSDNFEISSVCTKCDVENYYSYRRDGNKSGRMMGLIGMISR